MLADEPTGALDTATGEEIGELLLDLHGSGLTMVIVTHNPNLAARYASRTLIMADGRIDGGAAAASGSRGARGGGAMSAAAVARAVRAV